jgi:hypothetical protein
MRIQAVLVRDLRCAATSFCIKQTDTFPSTSSNVATRPLPGIGWGDFTTRPPSTLA